MRDAKLEAMGLLLQEDTIIQGPILYAPPQVNYCVIANSAFVYLTMVVINRYYIFFTMKDGYLDDPDDVIPPTRPTTNLSRENSDVQIKRPLPTPTVSQS